MEHAHQRSKIFLKHRVQWRYALLVAGSLIVLLLFAGFHGIFIATTSLPKEALTEFQPTLMASTFRLFIVGLLYTSVVTIAAIFLSHKTVGPTQRLESEIDKMSEPEGEVRPLKLREGDEFESLIEAINRLIAKVKK